MKDSYDQLDWQNGESAQGYTNYSAQDYDSYAQNPTYRNEFYGEGTEGGYADNYQESYDQSYDSSYDQSYDNGYYDQGSYDENGQYYNDGYQQTSEYNDPYYAAPPTQYSQADYDKFAQHPTYNTQDSTHKMSEDQFFAMIDEQKRRERMRDNAASLATIGTIFHPAVTDSGSGEIFSKDTLLFFLFCAFGCGLARLFHLPVWAYPMFAAAIAYVVSIIKKIVIDEESFKGALKTCIIEGVVVVLGIIGSMYLYSKGF